MIARLSSQSWACSWKIHLPAAKGSHCAWAACMLSCAGREAPICPRGHRLMQVLHKLGEGAPTWLLFYSPEVCIKVKKCILLPQYWPQQLQPRSPKVDHTRNCTTYRLGLHSITAEATDRI